MTTIIKLRRDTAANWNAANPILAAGEPGLETDTLKVKYGDGSTTWANLSYQSVANASFATNATTANVANSVAVANVAGIGNIATINLDGNASNVLRGNGTWGADQTNYSNNDVANYLPTYTGNLTSGNISVTGSLTVANVEADQMTIQTNDGDLIIQSDSDVFVKSSGGTNEWQFGVDGNLTVPGAINVGNMSIGELPGYITAEANIGIILNTSGPDGGFVVDYLKEDGNANTSGGELAFSSETGNTTYRISLSDDLGDGFATKIWRFDGTGNLTLPGNTFTVNYANGTQVQLGGGGNAQILGFTYDYGNAELSGEFSVSNANPNNTSTISINSTDNSNVSLDNLISYMANNKVTTTVSNDQNEFASFSVDSIVTVTESYNGYKAVYSKVWDDDPAFCKIGFYKQTANATVTTSSNTDNDQFEVNITSGNSDLLGLAIVYTDNSSFVPTKTNLQEYFEYFVDNILVPASGNIGAIQTNFYDEIANTSALISSWGEDPYNLDFYTNSTSSIYTSLVPSGTSGSGIDFNANIVIAGDTSYRVLSYAGGTGFAPGDTITFDGTQLNGVSVTNDCVLTVTTVSSGVVTGFTISGLNAAEWPTNNISDGGSDQYDTGNFLQTNNQTPVPYSNGVLQNSGAFSGNEWFVGYAYGQFIFFGDNTGNPISNFGTYGETGSDGSGFRETGYLNQALKYDFALGGLLNSTPSYTIDSASTITFDIGGINTQGVTFIATNTISVESGDLELTAPDDVQIQPADDLRLYGGNKNNLPGFHGGDVRIYAGQGGPAVSSSNNSAGGGGYVEITAGNAGTDDGNSSLGNDGGYIRLQAGQATGNSNGGYIDIEPGNGAGTGVRGNINLIQAIGATAFLPDASWKFPILTTARGDTSGGTLTGQTLKFRGREDDIIVTSTDGDASYSNSQRIVINPGKGADGTSGEGGDIYLWAGRGGDTGGSGGDIKIRGGYGPNTGDGGYVRIEGGDSFSTGVAGSILLLGGEGGNTIGGNIQIQGGYGGGGNGGTISIMGGISGSGPSASGNVTIASGPTTWDFKNDGNLTIANSLTIAGLTNTLGSNTSLIQSTDQLPLGILATGGNSAIASVWVEDFANVMSSNIAAIYCNPLPDSRMIRLAAGNNGGTMYFLDFENNGNLKFSGNSVIQSAANNAGDGSGLSTLNLYPDNSTGDDRYLVVDPTGPNHIHIRAGGAQDASNTLLFLGGEQAYVQIDDTVHEVQIGSYDNANATSYYWRFENDGQLTIPGNLVASGASPAPTLSGFSSLSAADQIVVGSNAVVLTTSGDVSATGNISAVNIGNISSTNLDGNVSNVLTGNGTFVTLPVINANTVVWSTAPISNTAAGNAGEAAYDSGGNLYVCVVANTWAKFTGTTSW